jgi:hypothetical protein
LAAHFRDESGLVHAVGSIGWLEAEAERLAPSFFPAPFFPAQFLKK